MNNEVEELKVIIRELLGAGRSLSNISYNLGQRHEQWDTSIYPKIKYWDELTNKAYNLIEHRRNFKVTTL